MMIEKKDCNTLQVFIVGFLLGLILPSLILSGYNSFKAYQESKPVEFNTENTMFCITSCDNRARYDLGDYGNTLCLRKKKDFVNMGIPDLKVDKMFNCSRPVFSYEECIRGCFNE